MRDILTKEFQNRMGSVLSDIKELKEANPILGEIIDYMSKMHDMCIYSLFRRTEVATEQYLDFLEDVVAVLGQTFISGNFLGLRQSILLTPGLKDLEKLKEYGGIYEDGYVYNLTEEVLQLFLKGRGITNGNHICDTHEEGSISLQSFAAPHLVFGESVSDGHFFKDPETLLGWLGVYHSHETSEDFDKLRKVDKDYTTRSAAAGKKVFPMYLDTFRGKILNERFINYKDGV